MTGKPRLWSLLSMKTKLFRQLVLKTMEYGITIEILEFFLGIQNMEIMESTNFILVANKTRLYYISLEELRHQQCRKLTIKVENESLDKLKNCKKA